jgi:quercetin dioxygenase-like cupin family protein
MQLPEFIQKFPSLKIPFPEDIVSTKAIRSDAGLVVFFRFHKDFVLPPHSHLGQWGTVIEGSVKLTIDGEAKTYAPGDSYNIPSGAVHGAEIKAGTLVMDAFEEPDRYPLKP